MSTTNPSEKTSARDKKTSASGTHLTEDDRIYVIGDIHGRGDLLREMAERVGADLKTRSFDHAVTVFLDNELRVMNFTPAVNEIFHLVETDIAQGRLKVIRPVEFDARIAQVGMCGTYLADHRLGPAGQWMVEHLADSIVRSGVGPGASDGRQPPPA